jgi:hypothetical protein
MVQENSIIINISIKDISKKDYLMAVEHFMKKQLKVNMKVNFRKEKNMV